MTTPKSSPDRPAGTINRTHSLDPDADRAIIAYAAEHNMSRSAAASALVLYGTAWVQERAAKRKAT